MVLLAPSEEALWAHSRFSLSSLHTISLAFSLLFFSIGLVLSSSEIPIPIDNYFENMSDLSLSSSLPLGLPAYLSEAVATLSEDHPFHGTFEKKHIRYNYGSTFYNSCWLIKLPPSWHLPSLLRLFELKVDTQLCIRTAILSAICIRMVLCSIRVIHSQGQGSSVSFSALSALSISLELSQSSIAMLITCLHQHQDSTLRWIMPYLLPSFSFFFITNAIVYTSVAYLESSKVRLSTPSTKLTLRVLSITLYLICISTVISTYSRFLNHKPCHTHVPARDALAEYICILCVLCFALSQIGDWSRLECVLSCERCETQLTVPFDVFRPAFAFSEKFELERFAPLRPSIGTSYS